MNELHAIPMVPLRGMVVIPNSVVNLDVGRSISVKAVEAAMEGDRTLLVVGQKEDNIEIPKKEDLYEIGTLVKIKQLLRLPGGVIRIFVLGEKRIRVTDILTEEPYFVANAEVIEEDKTPDAKTEAYRRLALNKFKEYVSELNNVSEDVLEKARSYNDPSATADFIASSLKIGPSVRQSILEELNVQKRLEKVISVINFELQIATLEMTLNTTVREAMNQSQKDYFLREKIKAIHDELGDSVDQEEEADEMRKKLKKLGLPKESHERIEKEISRYERMPQMMPEATIVRSYIDWVLSLPWNKETEDRLDIDKAKEILDKDHYGLDKIKERILEFLAVRQLTGEQSGSILCLVGPPGVGKTSLASSIAKAMNKKFVRASLGGMRDEAEIRGHRRTYLGALPGRMIQGLRSVKTKNPVFLLDEIDKLASDYKGDPSSALLEVLDPEQNKTFSDHYIEIPFDFSKVFWITTANVGSNIPGPLLDRMEIINLSSYTEEEKLQIAKQYLVPKQARKNGLPEKTKLSDAVLRRIISEYTREAGVRTLEKTIGKIFRKLAYNIVRDEEYKIKVTVKDIPTFLGSPIYLPEQKETKDAVGLVCGLAWTSVGGVVLPCEATTMPGTGKLILTGSLGNVMKESAQAALTYVRHNSAKLGLDEKFYSKLDIHIHLPEGATPKDGPSAGITMTLALVSALTDKKVRSDLAMTGEVTIRGNVLAIGGLKEKLLAALRHGIKEVLIPNANIKDIEELPESVKEGLIITPVKTMDEVLEKALVK